MTTAIQEEPLSRPFSLQPNPTRGLLQLNYTGSGQVAYQILDIRGKVLQEQSQRFQFSNELATQQIDLSPYPSGLYLIRLVVDGQQFWEKLIKE